MEKILTIILIFFVTQLWAQPNTEVYLVDIASKDGTTELINLRNISNNEGYDNQPSFYDDNTILFSSTRNGQTDIAKYNIKTGETLWLSDTSSGSEYSPLRIPNSKNISAVRLDTTGLQRLYSYNLSSGKSKELLKDQKVGYHVWYSKDILVTTVLVDDRMDLVVSNLKDNTNYTVAKEVGRSLHKIPNSDLISFIDKTDGEISIKSLNPISREIEKISPIPSDRQDITWFSENTILIPKGKTIIALTAENATEPSNLHHFNEKEIYNLSRIAISADGKHMAIVSSESPEKVVQEQVESFNAENLDAFAACYAEDVVVLNFPNDTLYLGNSKLKSNYKRYFENSPKTTVEVVKRIQMGNVVIDEELVRRSGKTNRQAAIYEVNSGKITSMTFVHEKEIVPKAAAIIDENLKAYRARNIDAFLVAYAEDIKLYQYPNKQTGEGKDELHKGYQKFFEQTPDLNCEIKNRMVIGNSIIDEEYITANGNNFSAVAIYEIENGKIAKVTFIQ